MGFRQRITYLISRTFSSQKTIERPLATKRISRSNSDSEQFSTLALNFASSFASSSFVSILPYLCPYFFSLVDLSDKITSTRPTPDSACPHPHSLNRFCQNSPRNLTCSIKYHRISIFASHTPRSSTFYVFSASLTTNSFLRSIDFSSPFFPSRISSSPTTFDFRTFPSRPSKDSYSCVTISFRRIRSTFSIDHDASNPYTEFFHLWRRKRVSDGRSRCSSRWRILRECSL